MWSYNGANVLTKRKKKVSPGKDDQVLSIATVECDGRGSIKYAQNGRYKGVCGTCFGS